MVSTVYQVYYKRAQFIEDNEDPKRSEITSFGRFKSIHWHNISATEQQGLNKAKFELCLRRTQHTFGLLNSIAYL